MLSCWKREGDSGNKKTVKRLKNVRKPIEKKRPNRNIKAMPNLESLGGLGLRVETESMHIATT